MRRMLVAAVLTHAVTVPAQTTWIVDPAGAGGAFTTIQAALNAAAHGDTIVVRTGTYNESLQTSKGVMVAGDPGVAVSNFTGAFLHVTDLPAGRTFTLRGFQVLLPSVGTLIGNCAGAVHLEDVTYPSGAQGIDIVSVVDSPQVTITDCVLYGLPAVVARRSNLTLTGCTVKSAGFIAPVEGMSIEDSDVTVVGGSVIGGASWVLPATPAIEMSVGRLTLAGRDTVIAAGVDQTGTPVPAINAVLGRIDADPAVQLRAQNGAPGITGHATVAARRIPSVRGSNLASGGLWSLDLHAPTGDPFCLFAGLPGPVTSSPWGPLWFDPTAIVVLACGTVGPGNQFAVTFAMGALPPGIPVVVQGAVGLSSGLILTTPSVNVVE